MVKRFGLLGIGVLTAALACGCNETPSPNVDDDPPQGLEMHQVQGGVEGTYDAGKTAGGEGVFKFSSRMVDKNVIDIEVDFDQMTIGATADLDVGVIEHDGYATDNGDDTQMTAADRAALLTLKAALDELGTDLDQPTELLRRFVDTWSEYPDSLSLEGQKLVEENKSYTSICWAKNSYQMASHDDWSNDWGDDASTIDYAYVSMNASGSCSDGTYFWKNSAWQCYEPDHDSSVEYAYGNCLGRCGAGCGSSSQLTWDCLDHDECVRTGHDTASLWCDDEFSATVDDWAAAPNCP